MNQFRSHIHSILKTLFLRFSWIGYRLNRSFSSDTKIPFLLLAVGTLTLILIGAQSTHLGLFSKDSLSAEGIDNQYGGWIDSYWWSIKHVLDPGAFADNYGAPLSVLIVSLLISLGGLVFLGALIGLISASIQQRLAQLELGNTQVVENKHVVVLGWGPSVPGLIMNLLSIYKDTVIVVLAPCELSFMREELRCEGIVINGKKLVLRKGIPSRNYELYRISIRHARSIIVVAHTLDVEQQIDKYDSPSDVEAIKTLLVLEGILRNTDISDNDSKRGFSRSVIEPSIVCEICARENTEIARIASRGRASIVSTDDFASRLLVQAARQPGVVDVFECILNQELKGIKVQSMPEAVGKQFSSLLFFTHSAVPIGVSWVEESEGIKRTASALNIEPSYEIEEEEDIVLLSHIEPTLIHRSARTNQLNEISLSDAGGLKPNSNHFDSVLILGTNSLLDEILTELNGHALSRTMVKLISSHSAEQIEIDERLVFPKLDLVVQKGNTVSRSLLKEMIHSQFDCIFVLADESDGGDADARSIMTILMLGDIINHAKNIHIPRIVLELKDSRNRELVRDSIASEIVVSTNLVSTVMAQISQYPVIGPVYRELLSAGGIQISLRAPDHYHLLNQKVEHSVLITMGLKEFETVIGVILSRKNGIEVNLSPDINQNWVLNDDDRVIVLSQQMYN